jgi:FkbM family methyltransferase
LVAARTGSGLAFETEEAQTSRPAQRPPAYEFLRPAKLRNALRRRYFRWRLRNVAVEDGLAVPYLGTPYGGWRVPVQFVGADWVVYCVGAGNDVSLERELIHRARCQVFSFDPTDASAEHVAGVGEPELHFIQTAISNRDGMLRMYESPVRTSSTLSAANLDAGRSTVEVPCRSLQSLMKELGHDHIDLLKYHVEGAEYDIFDPRMLADLDVKVLGIRLFHTAAPSTALAMIAAIRAQGYCLVAREVNAFTFVRRDMLASRSRRRRSAPRGQRPDPRRRLETPARAGGGSGMGDPVERRGDVRAA